MPTIMVHITSQNYYFPSKYNLNYIASKCGGCFVLEKFN